MHFLDARLGQPVAVVDAMRHMIVDLHPRLFQQAVEQHGRRHAVAVVVAEDGNGLLPGPRPLQLGDRLLHVGQPERVMQLVERWMQERVAFRSLQATLRQQQFDNIGRRLFAQEVPLRSQHLHLLWRDHAQQPQHIRQHASRPVDQRQPEPHGVGANHRAVAVEAVQRSRQAMRAGR